MAQWHTAIKCARGTKTANLWHLNLLIFHTERSLTELGRGIGVRKDQKAPGCFHSQTCKNENCCAAMTNEACKSKVTEIKYVSLHVKKRMVHN